jgi:hypothetical protein
VASTEVGWKETRLEVHPLASLDFALSLVGWTNMDWEAHSWEKEAAASALFVFLRRRNGPYSSHTNFKPRPQISSSEMLMKPSDNSHHETSANCPIEVNPPERAG